MSPVAGDMLAISSEQRMHLDEIQKDIDAHLDKLLTAAQKKQATDAMPVPAAMGLHRNPAQVMTAAEQNRLKLTDDQKKDMVALQKAVDGRFDNVLTEAQKKQLKSVFATAGPPQANPGAVIARGPQPGKILSPGQQDTLKLSPEQKNTDGGDSEGNRREASRRCLPKDQKKQLQAMRLNLKDGKATAVLPDQALAPRAELRSSGPIGMESTIPDWPADN